MKNIKFITLFLLFTSFIDLAAEDNIPTHSVNFELGGRGLLYSLNYEYNFNKNFVASVGFSFLNISESDISKSSMIMSFPISSSYLLDINDEHHLEFGIGLTNLLITGDLVEYEGNTDLFINPNIIIGYRFYPERSSWYFKAIFTPFLGTKSLTNSTGTQFQPFGSLIQAWGGIAIGYKL